MTMTRERLDEIRRCQDEARAERDAANAKVESMRSGVREMEAERDAMRHELAEMRAELERERVRRKAADDALSKSVSGEHRKWAAAIASALDGADRSGCESFVSREEMASRVAAMRAELERERKLRRESEEAFKAESMRRDEPVSSETYGVEVAAHRGRALLTTQDRRAIERSRRGEENVRPRWGTLAAAWQQWARTDPRNEEARRRGLATGARVRLEGGQAHLGTVCGFDTDGDPIVVVPHGIERYYAFDLVTDTEATT